MENLKIGNFEHFDWCLFLTSIIENADNSEDADKRISVGIAILFVIPPLHLRFLPQDTACPTAVRPKPKREE